MAGRRPAFRIVVKPKDGSAPSSPFAAVWQATRKTDGEDIEGVFNVSVDRDFGVSMTVEDLFSLYWVSLYPVKRREDDDGF